MLLEVLSDFQISIPELGTRHLHHPPCRAAHLQQLARADRGAQAPLPVSVARLPLRSSTSLRSSSCTRPTSPTRSRGDSWRWSAWCASSTSRSRHRSPSRSTGRARSCCSAPRTSTPAIVQRNDVGDRQAPHRHGHRRRARRAEAGAGRRACQCPAGLRDPAPRCPARTPGTPRVERKAADAHEPSPSAVPPEGMAARLLELGEQLRAEGVAVGTSELLDAFAVLREIPWTAQGEFREALAATLAKSQDDRRIFELVFDRFFFRAVEIASVREGVGRGQYGSSADLESSSPKPNSTRCAMQIAAALREGAEGAMRDLARMAIATFGQAEQGSGVIGVDVQRIRRALGLRAEPQPELPPDDPRSRRRAARGAAPLRGADASRARTPASATLRAPSRLRARWASSTAHCPPAHLRTLPRCTASWRSYADALPRRASRIAGTVTTRTWTCAARCAPPCKPAACPSSCATARVVRGARRSMCCAMSPRASPPLRCSSSRCCTHCMTRFARCARSCSSSASARSPTCSSTSATSAPYPNASRATPAWPTSPATPTMGAFGRSCWS